MTWPIGRRKDRLAADRLAALYGYATGTQVVIVTDRGVELPISRHCDWSVLELNAVLAWINALPEVTPESRRA